MPTGRVLFAPTNGPLDATATWVRLDDTPNLVAHYEITVGRQTLIAQTDTGTATVYLNDTQGLFDPRNPSSPYFGELDGKQILLQVYNPVAANWFSRFRGTIDDYGYVLNPATGADGKPVVANIQIDCVDVFDYLGGYGLTPGLDGDTPPGGSEDIIYYNASTVGQTVQDRIVAILNDVGVTSTMRDIASGNVQVIEGKYDPDEAALVAIRDAADAELPFIANIYVSTNPNTCGHFTFRGRYSRFDPDFVSSEVGSTWSFNRWKIGDGLAGQSDNTRVPFRVLGFSRARSNVINAAMCYPQGLAAADMPSQVYADPTSITDYGKHTPGGPISDLLVGNYVGPGTISPSDGKTQCQLYAELLVKNQKDPRETMSAVQIKSIDPSDARASRNWELLSNLDISDIVNIKASYSGSTVGFTGAATVDDYYVEGFQMRVTPANTGYDYIELDLNLSPYVWSADTHGVFPAVA